MRSTKLSDLNSLVTKAILTPEASIIAQATNDSGLIGFIIVIIDNRADRGKNAVATLSTLIQTRIHSFAATMTRCIMNASSICEQC